jgi:TonB family protein
MQISASIGDLAPRKLLCLAESLKQMHPGSKAITVLIFTSYEAAKHYRVYPGDTLDGSRADWGSYMHAAYYYDSDKGADYVELFPLGHSKLFSTRFDLSNGPALCRLQLHDRCLVALNYPEYPTGLSGSVRLAATIAENGELRHLRVVGVNPSEPAGSRLMEDAALDNLRSWRFEPAARTDVFEIVYSYELRKHGTADESPGLQFDLPAGLTVRSPQTTSVSHGEDH